MNENQKNLDYLNKAIYEINPDATYQAGSIDSITWMDGTTPISKSDIEAKITDIKANGTTREIKKTSGKQKLKDLGLDDDEIKALIGV
jgi:hypothetical protein